MSRRRRSRAEAPFFFIKPSAEGVSVGLGVTRQLRSRLLRRRMVDSTVRPSFGFRERRCFHAAADAHDQTHRRIQVDASQIGNG